MIARRVRRTLGLAALAAAAVGVGIVSITHSRQQLIALETCEAVERGAFERALALSRGVAAESPEMAACRCLALIARGDSPACSALMLGVLAADPGGAWAPDPALATHLIQSWRKAGRSQEAVELAKRAGARHPEHPGLFRLELETRGGLEDDAALLSELSRRIPGRGAAAARMRAALAMRHLNAGNPVAALATLGEEPPDNSGEGLGIWFDTRGIAHAQAADLGGARRSYARWARAGGDAAEVDARYAVALSLAGLEDPEVPVLERLHRAAARPEGLPKPLQETLFIRLILSLVNAGEIEEALDVYERATADLPLTGLDRAELERAALHRALAVTPPQARRGSLVFEGVRQAHQLWLSPDVDAPPDTPFAAVPWSASSSVRAERSAGMAPQRWVLRDASARVVGSGTVSPQPGREIRVAVRAGDPEPEVPTYVPARRPGDGQRRVALVLLDCGDWRITRYLLARGELPVTATLLREGQHAVLHSDPPLTAAALESLVWPGRRGGTSFVGVVHRLGVELAGLSSVGDNPFSALSWVMPAGEDLFSVLSAGDARAANLLLSHGGIRAGRHGEISGPRGARERFLMGSAARDLNAAERARFPDLAGALPERDALHVRTIAAELDTALELARDRSLRFFALRVEPLDILTHAHFAETVRDGQDDGRGLLFELYRYIDARLAAVSDVLDADDVLIVLSDHGIRTSMEHSHDAIWIAHGGGVPHGRTVGLPDFRGVSRAVADLLDVPTRWPDTGVAPWAGRAVASQQASALVQPASDAMGTP